MVKTIVHLLRHGEVHNPDQILYGRKRCFGSTVRGKEMGQRVADYFGAQSIHPSGLISSPLQRAIETATPLSEKLDLEIGIDERFIEPSNYFEGKTFGVGDGSLRHPEHWKYLINPFKPSWGEAYKSQVARMHAGIHAARKQYEGQEVVIVSHQLPIWIARSAFEGRKLWHDPRKRQCSLASLTSLEFSGDTFTGLHYHEPAADLLPGASKVAGA